MNRHDQEFEEVKRLLKLKQHEVPPPGYFNNFSRQVISRIRAGEAVRSRSWTDRLQSEAGWFRSILGIFDARPGLVGSFAASLCLLLLLTAVFAERSETAADNNMLRLTAPGSPLAASSTATAGPATSTGTAFASATAPVTPSPTGIMISTNPQVNLQPNPMLIGQPSGSPLFRFQTASFSPDGQ